MARGKYLSLEEARRSEKIGQFCKEHPSKSEGKRFERLLDVAWLMAEARWAKVIEELPPELAHSFTRMPSDGRQELVDEMMVVLRALNAAGFEVVPVECTEAMLVAFHQVPSYRYQERINAAIAKGAIREEK